MEEFAGEDGVEEVLQGTLIQSVRAWISTIIWSMVLEKRVL
jgi:hypothetical protein